ncbi:molybdenum cofactor guanylyltransferase [Acidobacterium sp. S8]|uniref:molybdenum cofactor guanylyltransferase n=1 Tax=Acidobacterium sp. S8 TaxID=1641854 RepID=UPI00131B7C05|nr:molybdenum cofactor guanylyltransferase [Acidobacterium sp. S8]
MNGFVLAGGRSTRMGRDKALLHYNGRPLVEHAVGLLREAELEPYIVGTRADLATYAPVIEDLHPDCGPLGGMEAALAATGSEWNVFLPVDLPLLPVIFLRYLKERVGITAAEATIPSFAGRPQPLCAVYSRSLLGGIRRAIAGGDYKVMRTVETAASAREIDVFGVEAVAACADWPVRSPLYRWFQNVNTPADFARLRA